MELGWSTRVSWARRSRRLSRPSQTLGLDTSQGGRVFHRWTVVKHTGVPFRDEGPWASICPWRPATATFAGGGGACATESGATLHHRELGIEHLVEPARRAEAGYAAELLAVVIDDHRRRGHHPEGGDQSGLRGGDVDLGDAGAAVVLGGHLGHHRAQLAARAAVGAPHVDEHGAVEAIDQLLQLGEGADRVGVDGGRAAEQVLEPAHGAPRWESLCTTGSMASLRRPPRDGPAASGPASRCWRCRRPRQRRSSAPGRPASGRRPW